MSKKKQKRADGLGPGTFVRFPADTREWLSIKARNEGGRSLSSLVREIVERAKKQDERANEPVERAS